MTIWEEMQQGLCDTNSTDDIFKRKKIKVEREREGEKVREKRKKTNKEKRMRQKGSIKRPQEHFLTGNNSLGYTLDYTSRIIAFYRKR